MIALAEHADDSGGCWPSIARLVLFSGIQERATRNALRDLEQAGLIRTEQSKGRTSSRYFLIMDAAPGAGLPDRGPESPPSQERPNPAPGAVNGYSATRHQMPVNPAPDAPLPGISYRNPASHTVNPARGAPEPLEPSKNPQRTLTEPPTCAGEADPVRQAVAIWNEVCGRSEEPTRIVRKITDPRRVSVQARLRDDLGNNLGHWRSYCQAIADNPGLSGANDRGWVADFDWAIKPANMLKVLEGKYRNWRPSRPNGQVKQTATATWATSPREPVDAGVEIEGFAE